VITVFVGEDLSSNFFSIINAVKPRLLLSLILKYVPIYIARVINTAVIFENHSRHLRESQPSSSRITAVIFENYSRHLRGVLIEDPVFFNNSYQLSNDGNIEPKPSA